MKPRGVWLPPEWTLVVLGVALYAFTLPYEFVFDDHTYLLTNPFVKETQSLWFMGSFREFANRAEALGLERDLSTNFILRPFAYLTFHLNYLFNGIKPAGFRAVNIAIHLANAMLVFALVMRLFRRAPKAGCAPDSGRFIAIATASLFLVHPLQIESVTYVIQRFTSLGCFFYLLTMLTFVYARNAADEASARGWRRFSIASLVVGMLTKEFLFTAPFMMVLLDWICFGSPLRASVRRILPWCIPLPIIPVLIVLISAAQNHEGASFSGALNVAAPGNGEDYAWHYLLTQPGVILTYLRLLFVPAGLNVDPYRELCTSFFDWRFLGPLLVLVSIPAVAARWHASRINDFRAGLILFGGLWFFVTLLIDSSIVPLPDVMAEHRTYLPSFGMFLALACLADTVRTSPVLSQKSPRAVPAFVGCVVLVLSVLTIQRNAVWKSSVTLWRDAAGKSFKKYRPWKNLGVALSLAEEFPESAAAYRRALEIEPQSLPAYYGLANAEIAAGRFREGHEAAESGLRVGEHPALYYYKAVCLALAERDDEALQSVDRSLEMDPANGPANVLKAALLANRGQYDKAMMHSHLARQGGGLDARLLRVLADVEAAARSGTPLPTVR